MQKANIFRLEQYLVRLRELKSEGRGTTTSEDLAAAVGISSSRVRQDMMGLEFVGKPRSGYRVDELGKRIEEEMDLDRAKGMVVVGCGNLARALVNSGIWDQTGFQVRAAFDNDGRKVGSQIGRLMVQHTSEMSDAIRSRGITAACLTVPGSAAQSVADELVRCGIRGIWNFASTQVVVPAGVALENQRLELGLMALSYKLKVNRAKGGQP